MKKNKYISRLFFAVLLFLIISPIKANAASSDYVINSYDISIVVNENNTLDITETIDVYFYDDSHGIIRMIPVKNEVKRLDGTSNVNTAIIKKLKINDKYKVLRKKDSYSIRIGDPYHTITNDKRYIINYNYNIGKDPSSDYDELYYNIIGNDWDTTISNVTFKIVMPKSFDSSKLGFSHGYIDSTDNDEVEYFVNGNIIEGRYKGVLHQHQGLSVRLELSEGYFVGDKNGIYITDFISISYFLIPFILFISAIVIWKNYIKKQEIVDSIEFYPPDGLNSLDIAFLYKGKVNNNDVISLLIYLASKGYIEIIDDKEKLIEIESNIFENFDKKYNGLKPFALRKLKEYDGNNKHEKLFIEQLFSSNSKIVTCEKLYNKFYSTIGEIEYQMNSKSKVKEIFEEENTTIKKIIHTICFIICLVILINSTYLMYNLSTIEIIYTKYEFDLIFASFLGFVSIVSIFLKIIIKNKNITRIGCLLSMASIIFPLWYFEWFNYFVVYLIPVSYVFGYLLGTAYIFVIYIYILMNKKRTKYGSDMLGRIEGFKNFLMIVEKEKLESLVEKYPTYFYDILPYTYVLGISEKWIEKFEGINIEPPVWYSNSNDFNFSNFKVDITNTMELAKKTMTGMEPKKSSKNMSSSRSSSGSSFSSSSRSSSSRSSSGGGSSGRGSGGGGGRSW